MPVKVRCSGCQKVLNAPDKAKGKSVKCPECGTLIKVPAGEAPLKPAKKKAAPEKPVGGDSDEFLSGLGVEQLESESGDSKVCPYCAAEMEIEEAVCRKCGMNVETGQMDAKEAKKRARKGADPALFYRAAWVDSWAFLKQYWRLGMRTSLIWMVAMTLALSCFYMIRIWVFPPGYVFPEAGAVAAGAEGDVIPADGGVADEEARSPWVSFTFWFGLGTLFTLGIPGWYWSLSFKIVDATLTREEIKEDRIQYDIFEAMALGLRAVFWPFVVMVPVLPIWVALIVVLGGGIGVVTGGDTLAVGAAVIALFVSYFALPYFIFPQAMVHMSAKYKYKAWILWEQLKVLFNNFPATLYWWVVAVTVFLPVIVGVVLLGLNLFAFYDWSFNQFEKLTDMMVGGLESGERGLLFMLITTVIIPLILLPILFVVGCLMGFPAVFVMRLTGVYGYYRRETLDLVTHLKPGQLVPFWVRFLCHVVDLSIINLFHGLMFVIPGILVAAEFPLATFFGGGIFAFLALGFVAIAGSKNKNASLLGLALGGIGGLLVAASAMVEAFQIIAGYFFYLIVVYNYWLYFSVNEGSTSRSTIGKEAFGVVVQRIEKSAELTIGQASMRHLGRVLCDALAGLPYLTAAFHPHKQALHDILAKTEVVFRGDK
jgi:hypothetical protein